MYLIVGEQMLYQMHDLQLDSQSVLSWVYHSNLQAVRHHQGRFERLVVEATRRVESKVMLYTYQWMEYRVQR